MIACDRCKDVTVRAVEYRVLLTKTVPGDKRTSQVTVEAVEAELCDGCAAHLFAGVRNMFQPAAGVPASD